ncbi:DUF4399 domain-containing protein [Trinickia sp. LjRoot230]|uniref:DUF4399 domain-containing protein n=1 Tax=Trinickia sp. LjRoot230 TaxID=3342288 RepID=UPI003ECCDF52
MNRRLVKLLFSLTICTVLAAGWRPAQAAAGVSFIEPADGSTVTNPVHLKFAVSDMKVAPAGNLIDGTGHHHILIDAKPLPKGEVVPANDHAIHYGKGQTEADVTLPSGDHTLTLQFADGAHRSYGPDWSQTVKVHVK